MSTFLRTKNVDFYLCNSVKTLRVYFALAATQFVCYLRSVNQIKKRFQSMQKDN